MSTEHAHTLEDCYQRGEHVFVTWKGSGRICYYCFAKEPEAEVADVKHRDGAMSGDWVLSYRSETGDFEAFDLAGVDWYKAPPPWFLHRCKPQTRALDRGVRVERCACGAINYDPDRFGNHWDERNQRYRLLP